jgi:hypothetical protein
MVPLRIAAALAVGFLAYTGIDILVWQRIFEANHVEGVVVFQRAYHAGFALVLVSLVAIGVLLIHRLRWALWYAAAFVALAFSGLEDALYYWLDGRAIPAVLPWLDANPLIPFHPVTRVSLIASAGLWLAAVVVAALKL